MNRALLALAVAGLPCHAESWLHRARHAATIAVCASQAADTLTSWHDSHVAGLHESNGLFVSDGRFQPGRMVSIKAGICGGFVLVDRLAGRSRSADSIITTTGVALTVPTAAAAVHNLGVEK